MTVGVPFPAGDRGIAGQSVRGDGQNFCVGEVFEQLAQEEHYRVVCHDQHTSVPTVGGEIGNDTAQTISDVPE